MPLVPHASWYDRKDPDAVMLTKDDVPDCLFPTDNEYGIPVLRMDRMANALDLPIVMWGQRRRTDFMFGTWGFYVDDYRFQALWKDPTPIVNSRAVNAIECNFTVHNHLPRALALYETYRKRWLARFWQDFGGTRIFVDMNVPPEHEEVNLLGVPRGWLAYATRGTINVAAIQRRHELALDWAGAENKANVVFVVYGGGKDAKAYCLEHGVIWVPEHNDVQRKNKIIDGADSVLPPERPLDMRFTLNGEESFMPRRTPKPYAKKKPAPETDNPATIAETKGADHGENLSHDES